jgi:hypothetical protein
MPRRNHNVDTKRHRAPLDLLPKRDARRLAAKARRRGWAA